MYAVMAMDALGYERDHPDLQLALKQFDDLILESEESLIFQPAKSPVWDTAYALFALGESGAPRCETRMVAAADWMLRKQVTRSGDWAVKNSSANPGGWFFEFNNEFYPDVDDTAMVLLALGQVDHPDEGYLHKSAERAQEWVLSMQCKNGGWASFDKNNNRMVFQYVPFADHNAMLDPATVDITGRVLEMLAGSGFTRQHPAVKRAIKFIKQQQEPDGSWFGRWGVNYIYGTMQVLRGLRAIGEDTHEAYIQQAAEWLRMVQNSDGGWGENCESYDDPDKKGVGPSTASQTAWAVLGLLAAGDTRSDSLARGIAYLLRTQQKNGNWEEPYCTGTGFPRVFYLKYHLYRTYFPLLALTSYAKAMAEAEREMAAR